MNVWGVLLVCVGFVMIYIGVKGNPSGVVNAFRPAGSTGTTSTATPTTNTGG